MELKFKDTCRETVIFSDYCIKETGGAAVIVPAENAERLTYRPFDDAESMVLEYLEIGYMTDCGKDTAKAVLSFVCGHGMPTNNMKKLVVSEFSEDAQALYLHFAENAAAPYTDSPEWTLETEPVSALVRTTADGPVIEWQTKGVGAAVELAYTLMLCGDERRLGLCKHCGRPFAVKNPKAEFCSPQCRNRYNVYKTRDKYKNG